MQFKAGEANHWAVDAGSAFEMGTVADKSSFKVPMSWVLHLLPFWQHSTCFLGIKITSVSTMPSSHSRHGILNRTSADFFYGMGLCCVFISETFQTKRHYDRCTVYDVIYAQDSENFIHLVNIVVTMLGRHDISILQYTVHLHVFRAIFGKK